MINPNDVNLIIFDMDGTIVPSLKIVYEAVQRTFKTLGWELKYSADDILEFIGTASGELYQHITPPEYSERWPELRERTRIEYAVMFRESGETFPGVKETLERLRQRGYRLALYSNASVLYFDIVTSALNILEYLDYAECVHENGLNKTKLVLKIKEKLDCPVAAVVGDRDNDIEAARETGSLSIGVLFGYGRDEPEEADITIEKFDDLLSILDRRKPIFEKITVEIDARKPEDRPFVVGISGIDGSGKTVFTEALADCLKDRGRRVQVIHLDDFHNPREVRYAGENQADNYYNRSFNVQSIIDNLLVPARTKGKYRTTLTLLDLDTDKYEIEKEYSFDSDTIVLFEGVFLFRKELAPYIDYQIYLDISYEESKKRALERDAEAIIDRYDTKYLPAQRKYLEEYPPQKVADIIIDNTNPEYPRILA